MAADNEGFLYPVIDSSLCTDCGLCDNVCPLLKPFNKMSQHPQCYAAMGNDTVRLNKSSSGGVFTLAAEYVIENGGCVSGAAFAENGEVRHIIINNLADLEKLKGSKYVESIIGNTYNDVKLLLDDDKMVLFSGTPCQVAGLKSFLKKDYENLLTIDVVCRGVPSSMVFKKYMSEVINPNETFITTNFRDKSTGWTHYFIKVTTETDKNIYTNQATEDMYTAAFLKKLSIRRCCGECKFREIPRQGDISLGDFWGIEAFEASLNDEKGTSLVLINSEKGEKLIKNSNLQFRHLVPVPIEYAIAGNQNLFRPYNIPSNRKLFFKLIKDHPFEKVLGACLKDRCDYIILNYWWSMNYGASITAWALQKVIENFGLISKLLMFIAPVRKSKYENSFAKKFADEFLTITEECNTYEDLQKMAQNAKGLMLGSDQVLRLDYIFGFLDEFLLNWGSFNNRKLAISSSFGLSEEEYADMPFLNPEVFTKIKRAFDGFDYLSSREVSGVDIFKNVYNLSADFMLDPVFLVNRVDYNEILAKSDVDTSGKFVSYVLDSNEEYEKLYQDIENKYGIKTYVISPDKSTVEDWLKAIMECEFLITDSFHGVCFALIFNKPFVCVKNINRGIARFETLTNLFGLQKNFVSSPLAIYDIDFSKPHCVDWKSINSKISKERERCLGVLELVLKDTDSMPKAKKQYISTVVFSEIYNLWQKVHTELTFKTQVLEGGYRAGYFINKKLANITGVADINICIPDVFMDKKLEPILQNVLLDILKNALKTFDIVITDSKDIGSISSDLEIPVFYVNDSVPELEELKIEEHRANLEFLKDVYTLKALKSYYKI